MWIPKGVAFIRRQHLFEAQHLLEEIRFFQNKTIDSGVYALCTDPLTPNKPHWAPMSPHWVSLTPTDLVMTPTGPQWLIMTPCLAPRTSIGSQITIRYFRMSNLTIFSKYLRIYSSCFAQQVLWLHPDTFNKWKPAV